MPIVIAGWLVVKWLALPACAVALAGSVVIAGAKILKK